jgi:hypothetical protein
MPLIVIIKFELERGLEIPITGYNVFIRNPVSIRNARLEPTEYKTNSTIFSLCSLIIERRVIPGTNIM